MDNEVLEVYYNDKPLNPTGDPLVLNNWRYQKFVTFEPEGDGYGEIKIKGVDNDGAPGEEHCTWGGLIMHCNTSDGQGPWHNFKTDLIHWRSEENHPLCSNDGGMLLPYFQNQAHDLFLTSLVNTGAKKIWTEEKQNTLIGSPLPSKSISYKFRYYNFWILTDNIV